MGCVRYRVDPDQVGVGEIGLRPRLEVREESPRPVCKCRAVAALAGDPDRQSRIAVLAAYVAYQANFAALARIQRGDVAATPAVAAALYNEAVAVGEARLAADAEHADLIVGAALRAGAVLGEDAEDLFA